MSSSKTSPARSAKLNEACRQARQSLPQEWLGGLDEDSSSSLLQHISHCRSCLEAYIALQAAAELACPIAVSGD